MILNLSCFLLFFFLISLSEGLGILNGRRVSFYLILLMPLFLVCLDLIYEKKIVFPKVPTIIFAAFIGFSTASIFFSVNSQKSIFEVLFYLACFLIFIVIFNHKKELEKPILLSIFILSLVFSFYTIILQSFLKYNSFFIPATGYQFVFSKFGVHNHLGDFLLLPLIISIYFFLKEKSRKFILPVFIFIPFFLLSYSRSAYFSLAATAIILIIFLVKNKSLRFFSGRMLAVYFLIFISLFFSFLALSNLSKTPILKTANSFLYDRCNLYLYSNDNQKLLFGGRPVFVVQAVSSFLEKPLFGVGPGNYLHASAKYNKTSSQKTSSSHNLFLDILIENGVFAFAAFAAFVILIIKNSTKNAFFFLFIALLLNFMLDYTHHIYSFFFLFFIIIGLFYSPRKIG